MDISGHPPFPNVSKWLSSNFGNLLFLAGFNFRGHFEGLKEVFFEIKVLNDSQNYYLAPKMNLLDDTFPMIYHTPKTEIVGKSYDHKKLMY